MFKRKSGEKNKRLMRRFYIGVGFSATSDDTYKTGSRDWLKASSIRLSKRNHEKKTMPGL